jgi:TctA family transporter
MEISLFSAAAQGFLNLLEFQILLAMLLGVSIGTFYRRGAQGLGMPLVYAIALPIVIKWKPITGIALLIGASAVSAICAAYLPILFGIPGGSGSQATVLDGYPMGKTGEGRRRARRLFHGWRHGSLIGTLHARRAIPAARPLIYLMGSPELFVSDALGLEHGRRASRAATR